MGKAAASSAVGLVGVFLGEIPLAVSDGEEEEEEEERGCMVEEEEEQVEAGVGVGVGMGAVGALAGFVFSDDDEAEDGTGADGMEVGMSATLLPSFPSLPSSACFKGAAAGVGVGREAGATGFCAFFSSTASGVATAGVATGRTAAFLAAAALDVSLEVEGPGRGGDAVEVTPTPPAALTAAVVAVTWPEMGLGTWFLLPPLFLFFFLPFAMMVVRGVCVSVVVWVGFGGVRNGEDGM